MKNRRTFVLSIALLLIWSSLTAQMPGMYSTQPRLLKWVDDSHFLLQTYDADRKAVVSNYDCRTGKSLIVSDYRSDAEILKSAFPEGFKPGPDQVVAPDNKAVVAEIENDIWYFRLGDKAASQLTSDASQEVNMRFSPDGKRIAYTKNKDLYVYDLASNKELRLTYDATDKIYNGWASWVYFEEILGRPSRYAAFWWAPDGSRIAYLHTDDSPVPIYTLNALEDTDGIHGRLEQTPYPKPGDPNPKVRMGIADISTAKTTWVKTDESIDQYIAWPSWTPDSRKLMVQVLNRDQNDMRFILADATTGDYTEIYRETRPTWVEFFEDIHVMNDGSGFILRSYQNDWNNLYYYGWDGTLKSKITDFPWRVTEIARVDETAGMIYFAGTGPESTDAHMFRASLDGKKLQQITSEPGTHNVSVSPKGSYFLDNWSSINDPGGIVLKDKKLKTVSVVHKNELPVFDPAKHSKQEMVRIMTSDGLFNMPAIITYPLNFDKAVKHPVVFTIYGGPDAGGVRNMWAGYQPRWYAQNGIVTISVDHRGSGQFGKKGLDYMHRALGKWEISDYSDAVKWLRDQSWADPSRMGMTGGSYGGYTTCMALTRGADYWTHGIADYSVTDWRLYDNVYTERFMDTPQDNPEGYKQGSALTWAENYKGRLMLRHGDMDDNVHLQNSIWLITKLQDLNKPFEFMVYPGERHGWGGPKRTFSTNEANSFWLREFFGK
jgi:dipeptidyl-peptidase-4